MKNKYVKTCAYYVLVLKFGNVTLTACTDIYVNIIHAYLHTYILSIMLLKPKIKMIIKIEIELFIIVVLILYYRKKYVKYVTNYGKY